MTPKIGGFGLSRRLEGEGTISTHKIVGTIGYMPPEFIERQVITDKFDIFSQGVVILQIMLGYKAYWDFREMRSQEFIELVHAKWRKILQETLKTKSSVEGYSQQVKKCIEIAVTCVELQRIKRPAIGDIVNMLNETEAFIHHHGNYDPELLLEVEPKELTFPFEPRRLISCSLQLSNHGDDSVVFRLGAKSSRRYHTKLPLFGLIPPRCIYTLILTMRKKPQLIQLNSDEHLILQSIAVSDLQIDALIEYDELFKEASKTDSEDVQTVVLDVSCRPPEQATPSAQTMVNSIQVTEESDPTAVYSAKFVARKEWFLAGDGNGYIYVYNYESQEEDISFEAHSSCVTSLAVHPTMPYVLSSSDDHLIKLWDWEKGWECIRTFRGYSNRVAQVIFTPMDTNRFASASSDRKVKIWTIDSPHPDEMLEVHSNDLTCIGYSIGDRHYLLTGSKDRTVQMWDLKRKKCIRYLERHTDDITAVSWHPELHIITSGSLDETVRIWNSATYRLENIINFNLGAVNTFAYINNSRRIFVGCDQGIATVEISSLWKPVGGKK